VASVSGGECKVFERPEYAIKGATTYDQRWADGNTEAGVGACGWERPKPRPPELDQRRQKAAPQAGAPKVSLRARVRQLIAPSAAAATPAPPPASVPEEEPPAVTIVRTAPVVPPPPPDPLDELIGAREPKR
jgi:hypothetical protein